MQGTMTSSEQIFEKLAPKKEKNSNVAAGKAANNSIPAADRKKLDGARENNIALAAAPMDKSKEDTKKVPTQEHAIDHLQVSVSCLYPQLCDTEIQTHVIRSASLVDDSLLQFWTTIGDDRSVNLVAFDVKYSWDRMPVTSLVLCSSTRCLIIQLGSFKQTPPSIKAFMASKRMTFVGFRVHEDVGKLEEDYGILMRRHSVVDICELAGRNNNSTSTSGTQEQRSVYGLLDIDTLGRKIKERLNRGNQGLGKKKKKKVAGDLLFKPAADGTGGGLDEEQIGLIASDAYAVFEIANYYLGHLIK